MSSDISLSPTSPDRAAAVVSSSPERQPLRRRITYVFIQFLLRDRPRVAVVSGRDTASERAQERWHEARIGALHLVQREASRGEKREHVAVAVAAAGHCAPWSPESILPARKRC